MRIYYVCDNEGPAYFELKELLRNFIESDSGVRVDDVRYEVENRGWYEGVHENGEFLVLDPARFHLTLTPDGWDRLLPSGSFKPCVHAWVFDIHNIEVCRSCGEERGEKR